MKIIRNGIVTELTAEEMRQAYDEMRLIYRIEDVRRHAEELHVDTFLDGDDKKALAERIINSEDCNVPENDQIEEHILSYLKEHRLIPEMEI